MHDIISIGSATQDVFLISRDFKLIKSKKFKTGIGECFSYGSKVEVGDLHFDTGGGGTNSAWTFANLGLKTSIVTRVGHDMYGMDVMHSLANNGIKTNQIVLDKNHKTGYSTILITPGGDRTILVYRGTSSDFKPADFHWPDLKTNWFYISSLAGNLLLLKKIFAFAKKNNIKIAWNPGGREIKQGKSKLAALIKQTSVLNINLHEAQKLCGKKDIKKIFKDINKVSGKYSLNLVTDGAKGAYLSDGMMIYFAKSLPAKVVNTTGAGDAFGSGFTAGMILRNDWDYALRLATLNGAGVVQEMGGKHGLLKKLPKQAELDKVKIGIVG